MVQKINSAGQDAFSQFKTLLSALQQINYSCSSELFSKRFSAHRKSAMLSISDSKCTLTRTQGAGGYPICLLESPFDPVNNSVSFRIEKQSDEGKKSAWFGVCLLNVVKNLAFQNCAGVGKGTYAIDQSNPYYMGDGELLSTSWNHHDSTFNQTSVGNSNLVVIYKITL